MKSTTKKAAPRVGIKFDSGKAPLSWLPRKVLEDEAKVFLFGAGKYGRNNFKKGMRWSRVVDAALRHIYAFADGENTDPETGMSHLAHAKCNLTMLMYYIDKQVGEDDRGDDWDVEDNHGKKARQK